MVFFKRRKRAECVKYIPYLKSTGTQCFDTEFLPNQNTRIVMRVEIEGVPTKTEALFGARTSASSNALVVLYSTSQESWCADYATSANRQAFSVKSGVLEIDYNENVVTINGTAKTWSEVAYQAPCSLLLLALNKKGTADNFCTAKLYYCQVYDNKTLIRDYRPCYDPDGTVCLYDKVRRKYCYNAGTGEFIAGAA